MGFFHTILESLQLWHNISLNYTASEHEIDIIGNQGQSAYQYRLKKIVPLHFLNF